MSVRADAFFEDAGLAALYDALYPDGERDDFAFYRPWAMAAGSVLDLGCGTGGFLRGVREAGHAGRLVGIDPARGMIGRARAHAGIEWRLGDASAMAPGERFDLVVMTGHAFQALVADEAVADLLARVRTALAPGGCFAFDVRDPAGRAWEAWTPDRPRRGVAPDGTGFAMVTEVAAPFDGRTVTFRHDFVRDGGGAIGTSRSTLRFLDAEALDRFLSAAGLAVAARWGDWDGSPAGRGPEIVTIARAA